MTRRIFLWDSVGAFASATALSALYLADLISCLPQLIGLSLIVVALLLCISSYSMYHYHLPAHRKVCLRLMAVLNMAYCCYTLAIVLLYRPMMPNMVVVYFLAEAAAIILLAGVELRAAAAHSM
jgi:hypothetical protein